MPIRFACTECGAQFQAPDHLAGKPVACPKCKKKILVPAGDVSAGPAASAPSGSEGSKSKTSAVPGAPGTANGTPPQKGSTAANGTTAGAPGSFSTKHSAEKLPPPSTESGRDQDEAIEAFMSQEREKEMAARAVTIDFNCSHCDEPLQLPMDMGGKQVPCPACTRIIRVPMPKRTDGAAWKANQKQGPAGQRVDLEVAPEGMQGQARADVSRETLEEADAIIERPRAPLHIRIRIRNAISLGIMAVAATLIVVVVVWWRTSQQTRINVEKVVAQAQAEVSQDKTFPPQEALLFQLAAAEALLPFSDDVSTYFKKYTQNALGEVRKYRADAGGDPEKTSRSDVICCQLISLLMAMGGNAEEARQGRKASWDKVQENVQATFAEMSLPEFRLSLWRRMVRILIAAKEANRTLALFNTCFPKSEASRKNRLGEEVVERSEAAGIMGLEFLKAGDKANAGKSLELLIRGVAPRPSETGEYAIALSMALNDPQKALPAVVLEGDLDNQILGQVRGYTLLGEAERVQKLAAKYPNFAFRSLITQAIAKPDSPENTARIAKEISDRAARPENAIAILRWCEDLAPGGLTPDELSAVFGKMPKATQADRELIGWCRYLAASRQPGSLAAVPVEPGLPLGELLRFAAEGKEPKPAPDEAQSKIIGPFLRIGASKSPSPVK